MSGGGFHRQAFLLFAATLCSTSVLAERCPPAEIRIEPSYEAPRGFEYAPQGALKRQLTTEEEALALIETEIGWDVAVGFTQRCLGEMCRVCVNRIEGKAGFGPGRQRLVEKLRGDRCRTDAVLAHEAKHSRVFEVSTRLGVKRLTERLVDWARRQDEFVVAAGRVDTASDAGYAEIEQMMNEGVAWIERRARVRNEQLDTPEAYETERRATERKCGTRGRQCAAVPATVPRHRHRTDVDRTPGGGMTETGGKSASPPRQRRGSAVFGRDVRRLQRRGGSLSRVAGVRFPIRPAWAR